MARAARTAPEEQGGVETGASEENLNVLKVEMQNYIFIFDHTCLC